MSDLARARGILADLVAFPTISSDSNLACVDYVRTLLEPLGARIEITPDETGAKANLFATLGPVVDGGVVLSGHLDVVPVAGQDWTVPPFALTERDGRLHGRGACDMKGFVACALALAPVFAAADIARPIHIALTHDEEVGCRGAPRMLAALARSGPRPRAAIVGEPTRMEIVDGHKGCFETSTHFIGLEGHGAGPDLCVNAVQFAMEYAAELMRIAADLRTRALEPAFDPPWTTLSIGRIAGGIAHNVVPNRCRLDWEFRPVRAAEAAFVRDRLSAHVASDLLPRMRAVYAASRIETEIVGEVPGLVPDPASPASGLMARLTGRDASARVSFCTEAGLFQAAGIPTIVCGPGDIAQAHRPDEFIAKSELAACLTALSRLPAVLSG